MKRLPLIVLFAALPVWLLAAKVDFKSMPLDDAIKLAKAENKNLFIDFYATWCGPCKWMDKNTFTDPAVVKYMDKHFISLKIDVESELGQSKDYASFNIRAMPTLIFLTSDGDMAYKKLGAQDAEGFLQLAERANDQSYQLAPLFQKYNTDQSAMTEQEMSNLLTVMADVEHEAYDVVWRQWRSELKQDQWLTPAVFPNLFVPKLSLDSPEANYLKNNPELAGDNLPEDQILSNVMKIVQTRFQVAASNNDKTGAKKAIQFAKSAVPGAAGQRLAAKFELTYYMMQQDYEGLAQSAAETFSGLQFDDTGFMNQVAWTIFENVDNPSLLTKTANWFADVEVNGTPLKQLTDKTYDDQQEAKMHYMILDTLAALKLKAGHADGEKMAKAVISFAEKHGVDADGTTQLLEQFVD